ncbi:enoyl-CoA hydratase-related protein [Kribbella sp. CA-253562]|uniref:enoyl-CoA hydratase-related protein n=1 Tax=Kribbella sp. CA-253562 TaxID=3239942 RepID=UPI003D919888
MNAVPDVLVEQRGAVLVLTLNRPHRLNAIDEGLSRALGDALDRADRDNGVGAVVIAAAGKAFCAGMDLDAFLGGEPIRHPERPEWGIAGIVRHQVCVPMIAAVHGVAAGGGFEIALACDLVVAEESARFALPEIKLGLFAAAGGLLRLPARIPAQVAAELAYTGRFATATELAGWGLVNRTVPDGTALDAAIELAAGIAAQAPAAVRATKQLLSRATAVEDEAWAVNDELMRTVFSTDDAKEGVNAFLGNRRAR